MIESFTIKENGYHPFLIREGWQLAQLNYIDEQHIDRIEKLDVHRRTDEIFVALEGDAVLIAASIVDQQPVFELEYLETNQVYNIPQDVWHNIAMEPGSEVLIAEEANTHISDFQFLPLSLDKQDELKELVSRLFEEKRDAHKISVK